MPGAGRVPAPESELLIRLFQAGVDAAHPARCLAGALPLARPAGRTVVIGAGKAAAAMAVAVAAHYAAHDLGPVTGAVVTRYGHGLRPGERAPGIDVLEAGHPVPDDASLAAGARMLAIARGCGPADDCLALMSGGASALLVQPAPGLTLADKQAITRELLESGAPIGDINLVRRRLSALKGGRLAREVGAGRLLVLAISDVPGDVLADIGSGPFSPDPAPDADARAILDRYGIPVPAAVARALADGSRGGPAPARITERVVASPATAVAAVAAAAHSAGWPARVLPEVAGPAREAARAHAAEIRAARAAGGRVALISGGETTVQVTQRGARGGRNGEFLLALALELGPDAGVHALAADTDGIDGTGDNAGAVLAPDTLQRAAAAGVDAGACLAGQQCYDFFGALGDLLVTGPTRTNVNDLRIALVA